VKEFVAIYEWTGRNYSAYAPDLPGCVAAGDTLEETEQLMKEAIGLYLEALQEAGRPAPEPTTQARPVAVMV
jgi:predicted RNase H-like HicB family nuclease